VNFDAMLQARLAENRAANLHRERKTVNSASTVLQSVDDRELVNFCSNDYLGLANDKAVKAAISVGVEKYGFGSGASHLVSGHSDAHHRLEIALAQMTGRPRALLFSTGYMANLALVTSLVGKQQHVLGDKLNHASIVDACRLASAINGKKQFFRYHHCDLAHLEQLLKNAPPLSLVVSDGVFSMDGDSAPLVALSKLCQDYQAILAIDDAHGFGCSGPLGGGGVLAAGLNLASVPVYMGTLGKAVGGFGAFVAGSDALIETLIQSARSYIYTTALPPAVAEGNYQSLLRIQNDPSLLARLQNNINYFQTSAIRRLGRWGANLLPSKTAIQPIVLGDSARAVRIAQSLYSRGFWVAAIRPPTVPSGTARLRITLSAGHSQEQIDQLLDELANILELERYADPR
jgi:8-amino-7-oxononanoate synthase